MMPQRVFQQYIDPNEPAEVRGLKKKNLYQMLAARYFIPEENSKGVNRRYLVKVFTNSVFRVDLMVFKRFEVELTSSQQKKAPFLNSADVFVKVNHLLAEMGAPELGFEIGQFPEDAWLYKIARYIDRLNIAGIFLEALPGAEMQDLPSSRVVQAKRNCERFMLGDLMSVPLVYTSIKSLWDSHKKVVSRRREIEQQQMCLKLSQDKLEIDQTSMQAALLRATMIVYSAGTNSDSDQIFHEEDSGPQARLQMGEIKNM
jgi:hypothetical protein